MRVVRTADTREPPILTCTGPTCGQAVVATHGIPPWLAVEVVDGPTYRTARTAVDRPQRTCPDCRGRVRVVRSEDRESGALLFCEDVACGWERFVKRIPSGADITIDEATYTAAIRRSVPRRRGY